MELTVEGAAAKARGPKDGEIRLRRLRRRVGEGHGSANTEGRVPGFAPVPRYLRKSAHRERPDRRIVNAGIGAS